MMDEPYGRSTSSCASIWRTSWSSCEGPRIDGLFVTHNIEEAVYVAERILVLATSLPTSRRKIVDLPARGPPYPTTSSASCKQICRADPLVVTPGGVFPMQPFHEGVSHEGLENPDDPLCAGSDVASRALRRCCGKAVQTRHLRHAGTRILHLLVRQGTGMG